jgi:hypothetical protein
MSNSVWVIAITKGNRKYVPRLVEANYAYVTTFKTFSECQEVCDRLNRGEVGLVDALSEKQPLRIRGELMVSVLWAGMEK